jgi:hypothetical protein
MIPMTHDKNGRVVSVRYAQVAMAMSLLENIVAEMPVAQRAVVKGAVSVLEGVLFDLAKTDAEVNAEGD